MDEVGAVEGSGGGEFGLPCFAEFLAYFLNDT